MADSEVRVCPLRLGEGGGSRKMKLELSQSWSDQVLVWQAGVFVAEEISMHKDMEVSRCGGSQALQVVQFMGSAGVGVTDKTRLLGRARPRRAAMLQKAGWHHRGLIYVGGHVESSWGTRLEAERLVRRWLESSRCSAKVGLKQGCRNGPREADSGRKNVVKDLPIT